jgi:hypothetical protein
MVPDASHAYGATRGFYVVVENKTIAVPTPSISMDCSPTWNGTRVGSTNVFPVDNNGNIITN